MALPLDWMADVLRAAGVEVVEYPGWRTRRQTDGGFAPRALMWHHDASAVGPSEYVPAMMADLDNNGAQVWVDMRGRWHLIAAGRMWHAGSGDGWGVIPPGGGNTYAVGIETDHTTGEPWPAAQLASLRRGTRALLARLGASPADALCGHKEYTSRKPDPDGLDMNEERRIVAAGEVDDMAITDEDAEKVRAHVWGFRPDAGGHMQAYLTETRAAVGRLETKLEALPAPQPEPLDYDQLAKALLRNMGSA